jgi:hypothetical protein
MIAGGPLIVAIATTAEGQGTVIRALGPPVFTSLLGIGLTRMSPIAVMKRAGGIGLLMAPTSLSTQYVAAFVCAK